MNYLDFFCFYSVIRWTLGSRGKLWTSSIGRGCCKLRPGRARVDWCRRAASPLSCTAADMTTTDLVGFFRSLGKFNSSAGTGRSQGSRNGGYIKGRCEETGEPSPVSRTSWPWKGISLWQLRLRPAGSIWWCIVCWQETGGRSSIFKSKETDWMQNVCFKSSPCFLLVFCPPQHWE